MDKLTSAARSRNMSAIRSKGMKPEMAVRSLLHKLGYRFRLHLRELPGNPDLVFTSRRAIVLVHGCFWHQHQSASCRIVRKPKSHERYWLPKLQGNMRRDAQNLAKLRALGWRVMVVWECSLDRLNGLEARLRKFLESRPQRITVQETTRSLQVGLRSKRMSGRSSSLNANKRPIN
jgi:DNA mismatch endonuclease (patch repair protein)